MCRSAVAIATSRGATGASPTPVRIQPSGSRPRSRSVEEHYAGIRLTPQRAETVGTYVKNSLSARRADAEIDRRHEQTRLAELANERTKLLQAHYAGAIPLDLLKTEQARIATNMEAAQRRLAAAEQAFADIEDNLENALRLAENCQAAYQLAGPQVRRLLNQAFFDKLLVDDDGTVRSELAEPFAVLLGEALAARAEAMLASTADGPRTDPGGMTKPAAPTSDDGPTDPNQRTGEGLKVSPLVGVRGLEPLTSRV